MWALGMVLHKLLFFKLPYDAAADSALTGPERLERLEREILAYPGCASLRFTEGMKKARD